MKADREIQRVDPVARVRAMRRLLPWGIAGLSLATLLTTFAPTLAARVPGAPIVGLLLLVLVAAGVSGSTRRLWLAGRAASVARRFPAADRPVMRDTAVYRGEAAVLRGRLLQALAIALAAFVWMTPLAVAGLLLVVPAATT